MRKLLGVTLLALVLFFATSIAFFGTSFLAMGVARADEVPATAEGKQLEEPGEHGQAAEHGHHIEDPSKFFSWFGSPADHYGKDMMGGKLGDGTMTDPATGHTFEEEPKSPPFVWMVLNFVLLLIILAKWGRPPIQKLAADRHDQIKTALDEAAKLREQAASKLVEYETKLKAADTEITQMVEGMRADAEADKQRILEAAERQAVQMKRDAELRIAAEIESARKQLTREVTTAAVAATEKLLRERMTAADQQQVITTFITGVETNAKEAR